MWNPNEVRVREDEDNDITYNRIHGGYIYPIGERRITGANGLIEQGPLAHRGNISLTPPCKRSVDIVHVELG